MKSSFLDDYTIAAEDAFNNSLGLVAEILEENFITILCFFKETHPSVAKNIFKNILSTKEIEDYSAIYRRKCEDLIAEQTYAENLTVERVKKLVMAAIGSIVDLKFARDPFFGTMNITNFADFEKEAFLLVDNAIKDVIKEDIMPELEKKSLWSERARFSQNIHHSPTL